MSRNLGSPVQTWTPVSPLSVHHVSEWSGNMGNKHDGRRRVFVQTETGCVLGMDLDRSDNVHMVKKRLQVALNVPTDEFTLMFGDLTLNNDLSVIRSDSHILLSRNGLHRSSSTPCLSPTMRNLQEKDQSCPIEILRRSSCDSKANKLVMGVVQAIKDGVDPIPIHSGLGGAYYFRDSSGQNVAIVKPSDEEPLAPNNPKGFVGKSLGQPGLKRSVRVGETGVREVAAYLLDYDHFANVPLTFLVKVAHRVFNINDSVNGNKLQCEKQICKIASLQQYIPHDFDASDYGTSSFPTTSVHRIGILDIRIFNTDRHAGNLLVTKLDRIGRFGQVELIPIDHGLCLPESLEDPYFEWIHWPQASIPFSDDELKYIKNLDPFRDSQMLRTELPMIREASIRVLVLCTIFLKEAAAFGLCLAEIGDMMSREFHGQFEEPSILEVLCIEARESVADREISFFEAKEEDEQDLFGVECKGLETDVSPKLLKDFFIEGSYHDGFRTVNARYKLSELDEAFKDNEVEVAEKPGRERTEVHAKCHKFEAASKSTKNTNLVERSKHYHGGKAKGFYMVGSSLNEQLPGSISFVKLADMNDEEWSLFLESFKGLLYPAFVKRKRATLQRHKLRLGTSCKF